MSSHGSFIGVIGLSALSVGACTADSPIGDPTRGEKLHERCLQCHGTDVYMPPKARIKSLSSLRSEVVRWGDYYNPTSTEQEVEDLLAWLNQNFSKFPQ